MKPLVPIALSPRPWLLAHPWDGNFCADTHYRLKNLQLAQQVQLVGPPKTPGSQTSSAAGLRRGPAMRLVHHMACDVQGGGRAYQHGFSAPPGIESGASSLKPKTYGSRARQGPGLATGRTQDATRTPSDNNQGRSALGTKQAKQTAGHACFGMAWLGRKSPLL